ncbi:hypothetical protein SAMN05660826_00572 [Caldanaerovirga acetigignens]|uniref:Uncharacterized protein n=1 Tax=Caldanaerovirga acetigignens TaxID=447595 RepID=A0A1M7HBW4_9FIRM|nr:hypothetical protein SAMN05660826_00572 [Caldanaerovirga acetigignens]
MKAIFGDEVKKQNIFYQIDGRVKLISAITYIPILTTIGILAQNFECFARELLINSLGLREKFSLFF